MGQFTTSVQSRHTPFANQPSTRIWLEVPSARNPYLAERCYCHGYEMTQLAQQQSWVAVCYLLFRGELPSPAQIELLEQLMILLLNPGPRHPATRAAMNAGVGRTQRTHILPIALMVQGGEATEVEAAMRFLQTAGADGQQQFAPKSPEAGQWPPGFGMQYGGIDPLASRYAAHLARLPAAGTHLALGQVIAQQLQTQGGGWLLPGVAAAALSDLGFLPQAGAGLYLLLSAPGLLAHGLEMAGQPLTAMPFLDAADYVIEPN